MLNMGCADLLPENRIEGNGPGGNCLCQSHVKCGGGPGLEGRFTSQRRGREIDNISQASHDGEV